jgi:hypothetical protein
MAHLRGKAVDTTFFFFSSNQKVILAANGNGEDCSVLKACRKLLDVSALRLSLAIGTSACQKQKRDDR